MEGETGVLCIVEMRNATGKVHWLSSRTKELIPAKVLY
jgi:hypothetical protein